MKAVERNLAPKWFLKFRLLGFTLYLTLTSILFFVYYSKMEFLQRKNDKNRISNLKTALQLEDADFINMVNDLNIDYDEEDLKEIEKEVTMSIGRLNNTGPASVS